jgi:hypothetical protein
MIVGDKSSVSHHVLRPKYKSGSFCAAKLSVAFMPTGPVRKGKEPCDRLCFFNRIAVLNASGLFYA